MILNESLNASCTCRPNLPAESSVGRGVDLLLSEDRWEGSGSILTLSFTSAAVSVCVCVCVAIGTRVNRLGIKRSEPAILQDRSWRSCNPGGQRRRQTQTWEARDQSWQSSARAAPVHRFTNQDRSFRRDPGPGGTRLAARDRSRK